MDEESSFKPSSDTFISSPDLQRKILFHQLREGTILKLNEKANVTIDLRQPRMVRLFYSENSVWKNDNTNNEMEKILVSTPEERCLLGRNARPQTARRGRRFDHQRGTRCYSRTGIVQQNDKLVPLYQGNSLNTAADDMYSVATNSRSCQPMKSPESELKSSLNLESQLESRVNSSLDKSDVFDVSSFDLVDMSNQNDSNIRGMIENDAHRCDQASTIIHLKVTAPTDAKDEVVTRDSKFLTTFNKSHVITKPPNPNAEHVSKKRKMEIVEDHVNSCEDNSAIDSSDEDLPLIMHCRRKSRSSAGGNDHSKTSAEQEVKRTYQRGNVLQPVLIVASGRSDDQRSTEKPCYRNENFCTASRNDMARLRMENCDESDGRLKSKNLPYSDAQRRQKMLLEVYERNNQVLRNTSDVKEVSVKKYKCPAKSFISDESSKKVHPRKSANCSTSDVPKNRLIGRLIPGPVSTKIAQMKRLCVNPRMMSCILRELTERKCPSGRSSASFNCISHQNYYDGYLVHRLTKHLPAREKITVHVRVSSLEEFDQVGKEGLRLWKLSGDEVEDLQKQVKDEMKHKRTEHIMPVRLQMTYEQIESVYEQVKKDMTTYDVTEDDAADEEDEDGEFEGDGNKVSGGKASKKNSAEGDLPEDVKNTTDSSLHAASCEIIMHDESSKTVSRETVECLEWREKHPTVKSDVQPTVQGGESLPTTTNSDHEINEVSKTPKTVELSMTPESLDQTDANRSKLNILSGAGIESNSKESWDLPCQIESSESSLEPNTVPVGNISVMTDERLADPNDGGGGDDDLCVNTTNGDGVSVIFDVSEMPSVSSEPNSSCRVKEFSHGCIGSNEPERVKPAYDAVRIEEYIHPCRLAEANIIANEMYSGDIRGSCEAYNALDETTDDLSVEGSKLFEGTINANLTPLENSKDNLLDGMISDSVLEASAEMFDSTGIPAHKEGATSEHMPKLHLHCSDSCDVETENHLAPPDLGLPIEYSDIWQHSTSPVQPPDLLVEDEMSCDAGSSLVKTSSTSVDFVKDSGALLLCEMTVDN